MFSFLSTSDIQRGGIVAISSIQAFQAEFAEIWSILRRSFHLEHWNCQMYKIKPDEVSKKDNGTLFKCWRNH